ncbi:CsgG/HfaB family protein [Rubrivirga sp.]|uniref:CsgG/HfaB family protein n=1 Tax=Rubrivirga sp. TaxID=1885344 RepID=UPI003C78CD51
MLARWLTVIAALLFGAGCSGTPSFLGPPRPAPFVPDSLAANVAVLAFENNTGDPRYDPLGRGLAHMMTSDLSAVPTLNLVERDQLQALIDELGLQQTAHFDQETALQVGLFIGADHIVLGSISAMQPEMRLDTRVVNVETAEVVQTATVTGDENALFDLQQRLAVSLIDGIDVVMTDEARDLLTAQQEANRIDRVETAVTFSEALSLYDQGEFTTAAQRLFVVQQEAPASQLVSVAFQMARQAGQRELGRSIRGRIDNYLRSRRDSTQAQ